MGSFFLLPRNSLSLFRMLAVFVRARAFLPARSDGAAYLDFKIYITPFSFLSLTLMICGTRAGSHSRAGTASLVLFKKKIFFSQI